MGEKSLPIWISMLLSLLVNSPLNGKVVKREQEHEVWQTQQQNDFYPIGISHSWWKSEFFSSATAPNKKPPICRWHNQFHMFGRVHMCARRWSKIWLSNEILMFASLWQWKGQIFYTDIVNIYCVLRTFFTREWHTTPMPWRCVFDAIPTCNCLLYVIYIL